MRRITSQLAVRTACALAPRLLLCLVTVVAPVAMASSIDDVMSSSPPKAPKLGAHTLLTQPEGEGSTPAVTSSLNTQENGSSLLVLVAGHADNAGMPTDSYDNLWKPVGEPVVYNGYDERFNARAFLAIAARGGKKHTVQVVKEGSPAGEITIPFIEIAHAGKLEDVAQNYPTPGVAARATNRLMRAWQGFKGEPDSTSSALTSGTVTTTGPATLVAVWLGDAYVYSMTAIPGDGFKVIDSYLNLPPSSGVQAAVAVREVDAAGTYSITWHGTPAQGAILWLFAFQAAP
ncbi:hypothetical protein [Dyella jiangningensis]|uniref:Uncharacterized protein n=1 Tax=Dyella jiangningensis TaxID=1379159 RepID=A0A328P6N3_9GAMM|nr:hypothetical protein [Dyella jiangningensis]RAO77937.1 hypothetical protein CA260_08905 [Dyella jiangningensis]